jgi:hypothetical protein
VPRVVDDRRGTILKNLTREILDIIMPMTKSESELNLSGTQTTKLSGTNRILVVPYKPKLTVLLFCDRRGDIGILLGLGSSLGGTQRSLVVQT